MRYAASAESAKFALPPAPHEPEAPMAERETPGKKTVEEVAAFLGVTSDRLLKTLVFWAGGDPVLAVVPGDRELNEAKLSRYLGGAPVRLATGPEIEQLTGGPLGFTGTSAWSRESAAVGHLGQEGKNWCRRQQRMALVNVRIGASEGDRARDVARAPRDRCPAAGRALRESRDRGGHISRWVSDTPIRWPPGLDPSARRRRS